MKVVLLVETLAIGGLPNHVLDLARALAEAGDNVVVAHGGPPVPAHLDVQGVSLLALPDGAPGQAARRLRELSPDLVHVHLCSDLPLLNELRALGLPLLRSFHDYTSVCLRRGRRRAPGDRCQRALGVGCVMFGCSLGAPAAGSRLPGWKSITAKLAERGAYQRFDAAVVGSRYMQRMLLANGFAAGRVHLVPYFSRFDGQAQGRMPLEPKPAGVPGRERPLELLFVGQAVAGKGLLVLVRALAGLQGPWRLTTAAAGPQLDTARALAARLGIAERIHFKPWVPQAALVGLYRQADLLVVPSVWDDPGPLVGLEALAMGTPVLGFPVGGIPDYTIDGNTGFLASGVGVAELGAALARALASGESLARLGAQGQAHVAARHGRAQHVDSLRAIYRQAARAQAMPAGRLLGQPA